MSEATLQAKLDKAVKNIEHYLDKLEQRSNSRSSYTAVKTDGYFVAEVPDWALQQWASVIRTTIKELSND